MGSAEIRRRGAQDFGAYYEYLCGVQGLAPLPAVRSSLSRGALDFNGDVIGPPDWTPVLTALAINKHLHSITIKSSYLNTLGSQASHKASSKRKTPAIHSKGMTLQLCRALQKCLCVSPNLKMLQIHGLLLRKRDLNVLTKGLAKSVSLEHLSLAQCPIADNGLETVCQSVKYSTTIRTVDFTSCNITWHGAEHMANIIKHQAMKRHGAAWAESLRYRKAEFEAMGGLRRITLNDNILIGDRGVTVLAQELTEDLWVKAVDLQRCGMSNEGARVLEKMLQSNSTLCVLDIRRNPLVDNDLVKDLIKKVLMNAKGQDSQWLWLKPPAKDSHDHSGRTTRRNAGRAAHRMGSCRTSSAACGRRLPRPGTPGYIPWRTAARASHQRGTPQSTSTAERSFQNASRITVTVEPESEVESEEEESVTERSRENIASSQFKRLQMNYKRLQVELEDCRLRLAQERNARLRSDSRLVELELENKRLRSLNQSLSEAPSNRSVLEDEQVLESIEASFQKFNAFLDLLKDAGLGQLASMAGLEQSDFNRVGHPTNSSTERQGPGGPDIQERRDDTMSDRPLRSSRHQSSRSSSSASATSRGPVCLPSPQELPLTPSVRPVSASAPLDPPEPLELQRSFSHTSLPRASGSERVRIGSRSDSPAGSSNHSVHSEVSHSYTDHFSEVSPALSSRSSSVSHLGSGRFGASEVQRSLSGVTSF